MAKLFRSNVESIAQADIVVIGVPDESGSHAKRKGAGSAPSVVRAAWNEFEYFKRDGKLIPISPMGGSFDGRHIFDVGDVEKSTVSDLVSDVVGRGKLPIIIGGDHSITTKAIEATSKTLEERISILYFDAHPDFVTSARNYYGSVLADSSNYLTFRKSTLIGTRAAEPEELRNVSSSGLKIISPQDLARIGLHRAYSFLAKRAKGSKTYVSIDLDCLDPAFAPGVSVPSSCGLSSNELVFFLKYVMSNLNVVGLDLVELAPDYDFNGITASLSARILSECIASFKSRKRLRNRT